MDKKVNEAFEGEKLNVLVGSLPLGDAEVKERFKLHLLKYLEDHYHIQEEDLVSAELEVVPAGPARDPEDRSAYLDARITLAQFFAESYLTEAGALTQVVTSRSDIVRDVEPQALFGY